MAEILGVSGPRLKRKTKSFSGKELPSKSPKRKKSNVMPVNDDEDFPRGGSNALTPLEVRKVKHEVEKDILFGVPNKEVVKKSKKKGKTCPKELEQLEDDYIIDAVLHKTETVVHNVTFKSLTKGDLLLGIIQEVFDFELVVSLPNNLTGCVNITNINKAFTAQLEEATKETEETENEPLPGFSGLQSLFPIGTLVKCVVMSTDSSKHGHSKIRLSVDPVEVNGLMKASMIVPNMVISGCVTSIEDHGYAVSLGIEGVSGFLQKKNIDSDVSVGQILTCLVLSVNANRRLVQVQCDQSKIDKVITKKPDNIVFPALMPGMLVKSVVTEVNANGLAVSFLGGFTGSVSVLHLEQRSSDEADLKQRYPVKSKILSRIMYICPSTKTVGLSTLQNVLDNKPCMFASHSIGDVIEEATVAKLHRGEGLLLQLPDSVTAFAHATRLSDNPISKPGTKFKEGTVQRCRILNFNALTGLALVTLQESIIEQPFIRYQDIKPGTIVSGTIQCLLKGGMLVTVSDHIRGFCRSLHFADVPLKHPEKKMTEGKTIKCRVLFVEPERKRLHLTLKKTLVNSEFTPVTNYSDIQVGARVQGFITSIRDYGCIVHFYNNVYGLVHSAKLGLKASENAKEAFYIGQVVTCVVLSCDPKKPKLALSFNLSAKPSAQPLVPGTLVDVDIVAKSDTGLDVQIKPTNTPAFLPREHLSDHLDHCALLLDIFAPNTGENAEPKSLTNILFYGKYKDRTLIVSCKQSLIKMASERRCVKRFEDLQDGMILPGFVRRLMPYGVFVEFSPTVYGLAPNSFIADKYVADAAQHFQKYQSVLAKVVETHIDRRRFLVSLKPSDCFPELSNEEGSNTTEKTMVDLLQEYIEEREKIIGELRNSSEGCAFANFVPGSLIAAKVSVNRNYGTSFLLEEGVEGFAPPQLTKGTKFSVGEVVDAFVLDHDLEKKRVYLSVDLETVRKRKENANISKKLKTGQVVPAIVQIAHKEYVVVVLPSHGYRVALLPARRNLNDIQDPASRFTVGQSFNATVQRYVTGQSSRHKYLIASVESIEESDTRIKPGYITTGVVKTIKDFQLNVSLSGGKYHGRVHVTEIADDVTEGTNPLTLFKCGDNVQVRVLGFRDFRKYNFLPITHRNFTKAVAELSTRQSRLCKEDDNNKDEKKVERELADYKEGEKIMCFVKSVHDHDIWMTVSTSVDGRVSLLEISNDINVLRDLSSHFKIGVGHYCTVMHIDDGHKSLNLSLTNCDVEKGQIVVGQVNKIIPDRGLIVGLPHKKCGMVFLTDLIDKFKDNPLDDYNLKQLVRCCVLSVGKQGQIELSTRPSKTVGDTSATADERSDKDKDKDSDKDKDIQTFDDIEEGDIIRGYVKTISDVGLFVSLSRSITARVQIKNLSHYFVKNWKPLFHVGQLVKGKVLSIDPCNNRIELSLKGKDVHDKDPAPKPEQKEKSKLQKGKRDHEDVDSDDDGDTVLKKLRKDEGKEDDDSSDMGNESEDDMVKESSESESEEPVAEKTKPRLKLSTGFDWNTSNSEELPTAAEGDATDSEDYDNACEVEESTQVARKKSKRAKRAAKKAEEEFLYKTEQALLNQAQTPQTSEEFDRALLATPNDSLLWLQYMTFYLHLTEIDKARAVAERALKTISFREESEKFNVWIGLLNLENSYGTQDSLVKVFQRAVEQNEPKNVFRQLVSIYINSNKFELAEQLYQTMLKRFKSSKKVWIDYAGFLMERGQLESARNLLQRSFKSLETRKHIDTITRFALLEFKHGEPERGRTLLDNILTSYPKRTDVWSMYIDALVRTEDLAGARRLFEREVMLKLSSRKMKFVFKKYLEFEKKYGDEESVENVKKMAEDFVKEKTGS